MRFLVDAHLPPGLCAIFTAAGYAATHTSQLPGENETPDEVLNKLSLSTLSVVVTKDSDFFHTHVRYGKPWKLLLVRTGNARAADLKRLFAQNLPAIIAALEENSLVELDWDVVRPVR